jgi:predicted phosphodiesterase
MTRILCSADHHFSTGNRWESCLAVHRWIVDLVRELKPDLFVTAGDIYDRASNPIEREAVAEFLQDVAEVCPVLGVKGNHDRPLDIELMNRLKSEHRIHLAETPQVSEVAGVAVALCPWPEPAWLAARSGESGQALDALARDQLRAVLLGLGQMLESHSGPKLAVGHWMIDGAEASTGQPLIGMPLNVGLSDLALLGADAIVAGHIHRGPGNQWDIEGKPVLYAGSPHACNWGETEEKSVVLLEWRDGRFAVERILTPSAPLMHLDADLCDDGTLELDCGHGFADYAVGGAECRLRYKVAADKREIGQRAAEKLRDELITTWGALSVKLEPVVIAETRARAPAVAEARTLADQLEAYWGSVGFDAGDRRAQLLSKLHELENQQ